MDIAAAPSLRGNAVSEIEVFLGPTMPADEAAKLLPATYLPPAAVGDVYRATQRGPATLLIVDGYFERVPAVWHKEILYALSLGIAVVGCASMGALRAAELHPYGMVGHGVIFERYRDGGYEDDDEVAVAHADAGSGYRCGSDAMVNIRYGLAQARLLRLVSPATAHALETIAKQQFYPDRHWGTLLAAGGRDGLAETELAALAGFVRDTRPDLKRADTVATLRMLAAEPVPPPDPLAFEFEPTLAWQRLRWLESPDRRESAS